MSGHRALFPDCTCEECHPRRWWCDDCDRPFRSLYDLLAHHQDHHREEDAA